MRIRFSPAQRDKLADITIGLGHLLFGSLVVPYIVPSIDKPPMAILLLGLGFAITLWSFAVGIVKR